MKSVFNQSTFNWFSGACGCAVVCVGFFHPLPLCLVLPVFVHPFPIRPPRSLLPVFCFWYYVPFWFWYYFFPFPLLVGCGCCARTIDCDEPLPFQELQHCSEFPSMKVNRKLRQYR